MKSNKHVSLVTVAASVLALASLTTLTLAAAIDMSFCTGYTSSRCEVPSGSTPPTCEVRSVTLPYCYNPTNSPNSYLFQALNGEFFAYDMYPGVTDCAGSSNVMERLYYQGNYTCIADGQSTTSVAYVGTSVQVPDLANRESLATLCRYPDHLCMAAEADYCIQVHDTECIEYKGVTASLKATKFVDNFFEYQIFYSAKDCSGPSLNISAAYSGTGLCTDEHDPVGSFGMAYNRPRGKLSVAPKSTECDPTSEGYTAISTGLGCMPVGDGTSIMVFQLNRDVVSLALYTSSATCDDKTDSIAVATQRVFDFSTSAYLCSRYEDKSYLASVTSERSALPESKDGVVYGDFYKFTTPDCSGDAIYHSVLNPSDLCEEDLMGASGKIAVGDKNYIKMLLFLGSPVCQGSSAASMFSNTGLLCFPVEGGSYMVVARPDNVSAELVNVYQPTEDPNAEGVKPPTVTVSGTCFPADATVELQDGSLKTMEQLQLGDMVKVDANKYSQVYFFGHRDAHAQLRDFVQVMLESGAKMTATKGHFVWANSQWKDIDHVKVGDVMMQVMQGAATESKVVAVEKSISKQGLYNPHTMEGSIVVDNVLASSYTNVISPRLAHLLLTPQRMLYRIASMNLYGELLHKETPRLLSMVASWVNSLSR